MIVFIFTAAIVIVEARAQLISLRLSDGRMPGAWRASATFFCSVEAGFAVSEIVQDRRGGVSGRSLMRSRPALSASCSASEMSRLAPRPGPPQADELDTVGHARISRLAARRLSPGSAARFRISADDEWWLKLRCCYPRRSFDFSAGERVPAPCM